MTTVLLAHGWGYDASVWDAVRARLAPVLPVATLDFGYFGAVWPTLPHTEPVIAVGHSLGALWWLTQSDIPWQRLLCINGFPRFCEAADYAPAVSSRVLARMRAQFAHGPDVVLADFHARCGAPGPTAAPAVERLLTGLDWLAERDGRNTLAARCDDIFALAGANDPIVSATMSTAAFADLPPEHFAIVPAPGHLLPVTEPILCADWIERLVR